MYLQITTNAKEGRPTHTMYKAPLHSSRVHCREHGNWSTSPAALTSAELSSFSHFRRHALIFTSPARFVMHIVNMVSILTPANAHRAVDLAIRSGRHLWAAHQAKLTPAATGSQIHAVPKCSISHCASCASDNGAAYSAHPCLPQ